MHSLSHPLTHTLIFSLSLAGDAFVGAWDVANIVSDLLMVRLDRELCSCAGNLDKYNEKAISEKKEKEEFDRVLMAKEMEMKEKEMAEITMKMKADITSMKDIKKEKEGIMDEVILLKEVVKVENEVEKEVERDDMDGMGLTTPLRINSKQKGKQKI